jgi:hypothetical protein
VKILGEWWLWGTCPLSMKFWHPCFDPRCEVMKLTLVWVKLPGLPLELRCDKFLWDLGNFLGKTLMVDSSYKYNVNRLVAKVLVNIDLDEGLAESIDIEVGD